MTAEPKGYRRALDRLYELQKFGIKLGLNSTERLLARLGDPHLSLKCLHIAGTNGKGSVGAMVEAALLEAGARVGMYTSPHLIRFAERFRLAGREITPQRVLRLIKQVWAVVDQREPPTFFEVVTAMAFLYYAQEGADWVVLETGLGGRLDATNVCRPVATVITNIGLEHQEYLGRTLAEIAFEKAGIIKPGVPLVHGVARGTARRVVEQRAAELGAQVIRLGRELRYRRQPQERFSLWGRRWSLRGLATNLSGAHQPVNACLALGACEALAAAGAPLAPEHFAAGLTRVHWPGRLERLPQEPGRPALWLDGAHNPPAAENLMANLGLVRAGRSPLVMVVGVMADKQVGRILGLLLPAADYVVYSRPVYQRAATPEALRAAAPDGAPPGEIVGELGAAIARAEEIAGPGGVVLITGSLFTVGEARAILTGQRITDLP